MGSCINNVTPSIPKCEQKKLVVLVEAMKAMRSSPFLALIL